MKLGIVDLGSHAVKCFVYHIDENKIPKKIFSERSKTRLAYGVYCSGKISTEAKTATLSLLKEFVNSEHFKELDHLEVIGTSALRKCSGSQNILLEIKDIIGKDVDVIDGSKEAELIARGFHYVNANHGSCVVIDIGGGSTEICLYKEDKLELVKSLAFGAIRSHEKYLQEEQLSSGIKQFEEDLRTNLQDLDQYKAQFPKAYGLSGGIKTLFKLKWIEDESVDYLEVDFINSLFNKVREMSVEEIKKIPGMPIERVDIALAGIIILKEILSFFGSQKIYWSSCTLKDGILTKYLQ